MNEIQFNDNISNLYNRRLKTLEERISTLMADESVTKNELSLGDMKSLATTVIEIETSMLENDVEMLLAQKEALERALEKKSDELQNKKYEIFNIMEKQLSSELALSKLHQVKLQSIDLYEILSEIVESSIITALEKERDVEINDSLGEVIKDITFESIKEGSLNTIRIRKILSTILISAIDVAEATPTKAQDILRATLKGMRWGLVRSIDRFKQRLAYMPVEAKHILIEDYDTIMEDLNQTDTLFSQVITTQASESSNEVKKLLLELNKEMHYDLEELVHISREAAEAMKERFSAFAREAVKKADSAMRSPKAQEAKRMGIEAWGVAKVALGNAIKTAKDVIDKK
ncbi:MAG: hypothetical protein JXQ67_00910 [Campylobacterales bacterium]|nr:hypothetical protein [Campylobacterales bacterium]